MQINYLRIGTLFVCGVGAPGLTLRSSMDTERILCFELGCMSSSGEKAKVLRLRLADCGTGVISVRIWLFMQAMGVALI